MNNHCSEYDMQEYPQNVVTFFCVFFVTNMWIRCLKSQATQLFYNILYKLTTKKTSKLHITGPLWGDSIDIALS